MSDIKLLDRTTSSRDLELEMRVKNIKRASEVIAQSLIEMIYDGELRPGDQLKQENIADIFGVSRIPVRDAFMYLVSLGLAVNVPRKGIFVSPVSRKTLAELYETRRILEGGAIRLAVKRCDQNLLRALEAIVEKQERIRNMPEIDVKLARELDGEFHRTLFSKIDNSVLVELIFNNWMRIKQARSLSRIQPKALVDWVDKSIAGHRKVLNALAIKDEERAYRIVIENIVRSEEEVITHLEESGWLAVR
jgi:DNA-binding GntR family transcriptional regulator